ncbi:MAG: hypothetical protein KDB23_06935, partial [Planctomycetales bacterium]|nr:hypothetical protein [Planctomycetales bacterium]
MSESPEPRRRQLPYDRPNDRWICGDADRGHACPFGPTLHGICSRHADCQPVRKDGRWVCGRAVCFGGPCADGPNANGECGGPVRNCTPRARMRWSRSRTILAAVGLTLGLLIVCLTVARRETTISPGPLSSNHATLLDGHGQGQRCSACHASATGGPSHWFASLIRTTPTPVPAQSQLCLDCHQEQFSEFALHAHGVSPLTLTALQMPADTETTEVSLTSDRNIFQAWSHEGSHERQLACSTCHHEHQGDQLKSFRLTNDQCASCHQQPFATFPNGHPEFDDWPTTDTLIHFPHELHRVKHFAEQKHAFSCRECHASGQPAEISAVAGYEQCATCHDRTIRAGTGEGLKLLSLPVVDLDELQTDEQLPWPAQSQGDFDGPLSGWLQLLLAADARTAAALEYLGPDFDFFDLDTTDAQAIDAGRAIIEQIVQLSGELARDVRTTLQQRLSISLACDVSADQIEQIVQSLPDEFLQRTLTEWFTDVERPVDVAPLQLPQLTTGNSDSLLAEVDPAEQLVRTRSATTDEPWQPTGWQRDMLACSIRYRPIGHADPLVRCLIELTNPGAGRSQAAEQAIRSLRSSHLVLQCTGCHLPDPLGRVTW